MTFKSFCTILCLACIPFAARPATLLDGGFEDPVVPATYPDPFGGHGRWETFMSGSLLGDWTVTSGSVDLITYRYAQPAEGTQFIDLNGNTSGTIEQVIHGTVPGALYRLSFYFAGNPAGGSLVKSMQMSFGPSELVYSFDTSGHTGANMGWMLITDLVVADSTDTVLQFRDTSPIAGYGATIDGISLVPIPEPSSVVLLLVPLSAVILRRVGFKPM